jgi:hypothetical protein
MKLLDRVGLPLFLSAIIFTFSTPVFAAQSMTTRLPLVFEPNHGQASAEVRYLLRGGVLDGQFEDDGVRLSLMG